MRTSEALAAVVHRRTLYWMRDAGRLELLSRGVYHPGSHPLPAKPDIAAAVLRVPRALVCLVSALELHEIGTQIPSEVHLALPRGVRPPRIDYPRVRAFRKSGPSFAAVVEEHDWHRVPVRVYSVAKTVADCFKYRGSIGLDVAVEALQEAVRGRRATPAGIMECARVDRVQNVMRPYLEALL